MNREQLLAAGSRKVETVEVSGIGTVGIRSLSARDALALEVSMGADRTSGEGLASMVAAQLAAFICDEGGKPLLSQDEAAQLVDRWAAHQVQAVIRAGVKLNALGESSVEDAGGN